MTTTKTSPEVNSLKYVMNAYKGLLSKEEEMKAQSGNDQYYELQSELKTDIKLFLRLNFTYLNTRQLLKLCALVSAHRPVEPFSFLVTCSNLIEE